MITQEQLNKFARDAREKVHIYKVPAHVQRGFLAYLTEGTAPGDACLAILRNDLRGVADYADHVLRGEATFNIVGWIENTFPKQAFGSTAQVKWWMKEFETKRLQELKAKRDKEKK